MENIVTRIREKARKKHLKKRDENTLKQIKASKATYAVIYLGEDKETCAKHVIRPSWVFLQQVRGGKSTWGDLVRAITGGNYESYDLK